MLAGEANAFGWGYVLDGVRQGEDDRRRREREDFALEQQKREARRLEEERRRLEAEREEIKRQQAEMEQGQSEDLFERFGVAPTPNCSPHMAMLPDGSYMNCTTCCVGQNCNTNCR